jgi:hypothetical protein
MSENHAGWRRRAAPNHVLVGTADIRGYDFEDDTMIDRISRWVTEARKVDVLDFDAAGFEVNYAAIIV